MVPLDGLELPACLLELAVDVAHLTLQGLRFAMVFTTFKPRVCHEVRRADFGRATRTERAEKKHFWSDVSEPYHLNNF
jgi:hypothetical protein